LLGNYIRNNRPNFISAYIRLIAFAIDHDEQQAGRLHLNLQDFKEIGFTPTSLEPFAFHALFGRGFLFEQVEGHVAQYREILWSMADADTRVIFAERYVSRAVRQLGENV